MNARMSKTAAIKTARQYGRIWGSGTSWVVAGPYDARDPDGAYTEATRTSYWAARACLTSWRACIAAAAMYGRAGEEALAEIEARGAHTSLPALVNAVVERMAANDL